MNLKQIYFVKIIAAFGWFEEIKTINISEWLTNRSDHVTFKGDPIKSQKLHYNLKTKTYDKLHIHISLLVIYYTMYMN